MKRIQSGAKPQRLGRRDYDYIRSYHPQIYAGTVSYPKFPPEYLTDNTNWNPDQNREGQPFGCTNYASTMLARILGVASATVDAIEAITHANALGGYGVLQSIDAARKVLGWFQWRFVIQATGRLDYFDAFRLAQMSGLPEPRAISWGTPWFVSWEIDMLNGRKVMSMPTDKELADIKANPNSQTWHNSVLDGFSSRFEIAPNQLLYRDKSWQSTVGFIYFPREVINVVQNITSTIAVVTTGTPPPAIKRIPLPDWFWSLWDSWLGWAY